MSNDMVVEQLDVATTYLNGTLEEKIYMEIPKYIHRGLCIVAQTIQNETTWQKKHLKCFTN